MARLGSSNVKILGRVAPITKDIFGTSEVKNESSEALLMSQMESAIELETKISTSKIDFFMEKFQIPALPAAAAVEPPADSPPRLGVGPGEDGRCAL